MPDTPTISGGPSETGSNAAASTGVTLTADASSHTKGAWSEVIASTDYAASWLHVMVARIGNAARFLLDIGVGASTAEVVLIPNLHIDCRSTGSQTARSWLLPIAVPAGTRLSARIQSNGGGNVIPLGITAISAPITAPPPLGRVEALGDDTGTSAGTALDPGGVAHTDSGWVQLIASTGFNYRWMCLGVGHGTFALAASTDWLIDLAVGGSGSEQVFMSDLVFSSGATADSPIPGGMSFPVAVASGSRVSARIRSNNITANERTMEIVAHGVG